MDSLEAIREEAEDLRDRFDTLDRDLYADDAAAVAELVLKLASALITELGQLIATVNDTEPGRTKDKP